MNKLLKAVRMNNNRDEVIKKSIVEQLSNSVKELQYSGIEENCSHHSVNPTEAANQLCIIIEALFLHGLKDSLKYRFQKVIADVDTRPEPNFWAPLLVISHKEIIDQVKYQIVSFHSSYSLQLSDNEIATNYNRNWTVSSLDKTST